MLTQDDRERMKMLRAQGYSVSELAKALNISRNTAAKYLKQLEEQDKTEEQGPSIKDVEKKQRTTLIGNKLAASVADMYMNIHDEIETTMQMLTRIKLLYEPLAQKLNMSFEEFLLRAVEKYVESRQDDLEFEDMAQKVFWIKVLRRL